MFKHSVSPNSELLDKVDKYLLLPVEDQTLEPLSWWKSHAQQFPLLSIVAKCILGIPASSVSVERTFNIYLFIYLFIYLRLVTPWNI
jgi:hypothetical protein